jgi:hypothetical protein
VAKFPTSPGQGAGSALPTLGRSSDPSNQRPLLTGHQAGVVLRLCARSDAAGHRPSQRTAHLYLSRSGAPVHPSGRAGTLLSQPGRCPHPRTWGTESQKGRPVATDCPRAPGLGAHLLKVSIRHLWASARLKLLDHNRKFHAARIKRWRTHRYQVRKQSSLPGRVSPEMHHGEFAFGVLDKSVETFCQRQRSFLNRKMEL